MNPIVSTRRQLLGALFCAAAAPAIVRAASLMDISVSGNTYRGIEEILISPRRLTWAVYDREIRRWVAMTDETLRIRYPELVTVSSALAVPA